MTSKRGWGQLSWGKPRGRLECPPFRAVLRTYFSLRHGLANIIPSHRAPTFPLPGPGWLPHILRYRLR